MSKLKIERNKQKIVDLLNKNIDLQYQLKIKSFTSFSEKEINIGTKVQSKKVIVKIGHWFEWFYDEDYPNDKKHAVKIERSSIYEIDGQKSNHWNKITYFTIDDI